MPLVRSTVRVNALDRSSSSSSMSSNSQTSTDPIASDASVITPNQGSTTSKRKRTRRRITSEQLAALEAAFAQNSHPPQKYRDELAQAIGMEPRSVTIWWQNKRQAERKLALHQAINRENNVLTSINNALLVAEVPHLLWRTSSPSLQSGINSPATSTDMSSAYRTEQPLSICSTPRSPLSNSPLPPPSDLEMNGRPVESSGIDEDMIQAAVVLAQLSGL